MFKYSIVYLYNHKDRHWEIYLRKELNGIYQDDLHTEFHGNSAEALNAANNVAKYYKEAYKIEISDVFRIYH